MEKSSIEIFDENFKIITQNIARAAQKSGRKPQDITLLAATKTVDISVINHAIESGIEFIGANREQEVSSKEEQYLPVHKHFIGHLQTNKVKDIINRVELIHSVDSYHLAEEISRQAQKNNKEIDILLEINIGNEQSKSGFCCDEAVSAAEKISKLGGVKIKGLMAIPPIDPLYENTRKELLGGWWFYLWVCLTIMRLRLKRAQIWCASERHFSADEITKFKI